MTELVAVKDVPYKTLKAAMCEALIEHWKRNGNILGVIIDGAAGANVAINEESQINAYRERCFGSQWIGVWWLVRPWVAANAPALSDALFDKKSSTDLQILAESINWRRAKGANYHKTPKDPSFVDRRVMLRELSKNHDWNTCK